MPLILGANSVTGGYEIDNSLRFNTGSSDYLSKNLFCYTNKQTTMTISAFWVKRGNIGTVSNTSCCRNRWQL
jgi:nicotinamide mononucleotide (NMN) deamidase PncC